MTTSSAVPSEHNYSLCLKGREKLPREAEYCQEHNCGTVSTDHYVKNSTSVTHQKRIESPGIQGPIRDVQTF